MSLFQQEEIDSFSISYEISGKESDFVSILMKSMPIEKFRTESLTERDDTFAEILSKIPRYTIRGNDISFDFLKNQLRVRLGERGPPFAEPKEFKINEKQLSTISLDINYLLGIMIEALEATYSEITITSTLRLIKKSKVVKYSNISNKECKEIFGNGFEVTGICLAKEEGDNKIKFRIEETDENTLVTYIKSWSLDGTIDLNYIINLQLSEINDLSLKM